LNFVATYGLARANLNRAEETSALETDREMEPRRKKKHVTDTDSDVDSSSEMSTLPQPFVPPDLHLTAGCLHFY